ncbi:uncharacterized protein LOC135470656 [Liolophura sinensis]|uniref:uncharacterized protein LOC135470656 n=1 Tax=Liolophura sinensis TaxID=3198878 RepID=UPI00315945A2
MAIDIMLRNLNYNLCFNNEQIEGTRGGTSADADIEPGMSDCTSSKTVSNLQRRSSTSFVEEAVPTTKRRRKSGRLVISTMGQAARKSSVRQRQKVSCPHETVSSLRRKALAKSLKDIKVCSEDPIPNRPPWVS